VKDSSFLPELNKNQRLDSPLITFLMQYVLTQARPNNKMEILSFLKVFLATYISRNASGFNAQNTRK